MIYLIISFVLLDLYTFIDAWMDGLVFYQELDLWHKLKIFRMISLWFSGFFGYVAYANLGDKGILFWAITIVVVLLIRWGWFEFWLNYFERKY